MVFSFWCIIDQPNARELQNVYYVVIPTVCLSVVAIMVAILCESAYCLLVCPLCKSIGCLPVCPSVPLSY